MIAYNDLQTSNILSLVCHNDCCCHRSTFGFSYGWNCFFINI